jgi:hypothetical protein
MTKNAQINAYPTADKKAPLTFYVYLNQLPFRIIIRGGINMSKGIQQMKIKMLARAKKTEPQINSSAIVGNGFSIS